jgi:hypothetical protein
MGQCKWCGMPQSSNATAVCNLNSATRSHNFTINKDKKSHFGPASKTMTSKSSRRAKKVHILLKKERLLLFSIWNDRLQCKGRYKKYTLVQALRLCTGRTAHTGSRGTALLFHDHGTRRGWRVSVTPLPLFTAGKTRYPLYRRLGGLQGRSGHVRNISPRTGIRSPDRPARNQSLYRLRYPAHRMLDNPSIN